MLRFTGLAQQTCDGCTRRDLLQAGGLSALGLLLPQVLNPSAAASPSTGFGRAKARVIIYLFGGPSQLDTFDLKPDAPAEIRGEFVPIGTTVPGIRICEHLPRLARQADQFCLIRSMNHPHPRHGWGLYYMLTGRRHNRPELKRSLGRSRRSVGALLAAHNALCSVPKEYNWGQGGEPAKRGSWPVPENLS